MAKAPHTALPLGLSILANLLLAPNPLPVHIRSLVLPQEAPALLRPTPLSPKLRPT